MPTPGPQVVALNSEADEIFFGGAAGGGKTSLVLGAAMTMHRRSIIFRKEFPQFKEIQEQLTKTLEPIGGLKLYNGQSHIWTMLQDRTIEIASVSTPRAKEKYKGRPHDLKAFDELPDFTRETYRFLIAWNRTTIPGQRCRVLSAGNPPTTPEGEWVVQYWGPWLDTQHPAPAASGEVRYFAMIDNVDTEVENGQIFTYKNNLVYPKSRTFILSLVEDNPYLGADYYARLDNLDEPMRSLLRWGKFGSKIEDHEWQVIPSAWVRAAMERGRKSSGAFGKLSALGVDVARGGSDKTVIAPRYGNHFEALIKYPGIKTPDGPTAGAFVLQEREDRADILVDVVGVGASCYDWIAANIEDDNVQAINWAEKEIGTDKTGRFRYRNKRAAHWWRFREALDPLSGIDIELPDDRELYIDLCTPRYSVKMGGILIESKEEIKKRIGRSPDCGDAVVMAAVERQEYGF